MKDKDTKRRVLNTQRRDNLSTPGKVQIDRRGVEKQAILPGFEEGRYVPRRSYDRQLFGAPAADLMKRDNRVNIRVSGSDLDTLNEEALRRGIPVQSLMAGIIRDYVSSTTDHDPAAGSQVLEGPKGEDYAKSVLEPEVNTGKTRGILRFKR